MPSPVEQGAGFSWTGQQDNGYGSFSGVFGRIINNLTGRSASNQFNADEAEKVRVFNSAEAQKQRDFEEMMSNTAHQRAVADMKAAGINPMMAAGDAASTPSMTPANAGNSASAATHSGSLGIMNLISRVAQVATAKGLEAKFTNSAMKAADNHELVGAKIRHMAAQEMSMSAGKSSEADAIRKAIERERAFADERMRLAEERHKKEQELYMKGLGY